jgi:hypothetical protein
MRKQYNLQNDTRGAVMFMGVFFACFLIGSLWFLIGIGDAVVFREQAQEAADSATFASAVLHAKGMNLNLVMFGLTILYVLGGLVVDLLLAVTPFGGFGVTFRVAQQVDNLASLYRDRFLLPIGLPTGGKVGTGVARLAAWAGTFASFSPGSTYGVKTRAFSTSNVPGFAASSALALATSVISKNKKPNAYSEAVATAGRKLGLPVETQKAEELCGNGAALIVSFVRSKVIQLLSTLFGLGEDTTVAKAITAAAVYVANWLGSVVKGMHCAAKFASGAVGLGQWLASKAFKVYEPKSAWGDDNIGPKKFFATARNASEWMQVYGSASGTLNDTEGSKVSIAYRIKAGEGVESPGSPGEQIYTAQGEFYYECGDKWSSNACNGVITTFPQALYGMNWRARLVRYRGIQLTTLAGTVGATALTDFVAKYGVPLLAERVKSEPARKTIEDYLKSLKKFADRPTGEAVGYH